jgi:hypothetical protein
MQDRQAYDGLGAVSPAGDPEGFSQDLTWPIAASGRWDARRLNPHFLQSPSLLLNIS